MSTTSKSTTSKKRAPAAVSKIDLSGLSKFSLAQVMEGGLRAAGGRPLELSLDEVVEDAEQARGVDNPGFSAESLAELAESIRESNGVKTPISVRSKNADGKHVINHGARRYRASKLAGMTTINAFIDDSHGDYDQAVENIQREAFTPMEIALFIQKRERLGDDRKTIAKRLGKSKAFVTFHAALLGLPPVLRDAYDGDRCRDTQLLYNLSNLAKEHPEEVSRYVKEAPEITRSGFEALKASLRSDSSRQDEPPKGASAAAPTPVLAPAPSPSAGSAAAAGQYNVTTQPRAERAGTTEGSGPAEVSSSSRPGAKKSVVMVSRKKQLYMLRIDLPPSALHMGWIEDPANGERSEVELAELRIDSIVNR